MALASGTEFLLFVAGEPDATGDSMRDVNTSIGSRLVSTIAPVGHWTQPSRREQRPGFSSGPEAEEQSWHIPQQQHVCVDLVVNTANNAGKSVRVIDVNRPEDFRELVGRWVGSADVLPLLVSPDGARLEGVEEFVPHKVRRFILRRPPAGALPGSGSQPLK